MKLKFASRSLSTFVADFVRDESAAEVVEVVVLIGLIAVVCLVAMKEFGPKVQMRWIAVDDAQ